MQFSNTPISKRALELQDVTNKIREIWRNNEGPFENIFRILSYLVPFVPGLGWSVFILEKIAATFGWGMGDLGGALDKALDLQPGPHVDITKPMIGSGLTMAVEPKQASSNEELVKIAWIGGLLKLIGGPTRIANFIWKAVKFLLLAFGITKIGDMYTEVTGTKKAPGEIALDEMEEGKGPSIMSPTDVQGLMGLVSDPTKLVSPLLGK